MVKTGAASDVDKVTRLKENGVKASTERVNKTRNGNKKKETIDLPAEKKETLIKSVKRRRSARRKVITRIENDETKAEEKIFKKAKNNKANGRGVIYVGRIPHGFYEKQMKSYFSQFGKVLRLKISRNRKTGASRHFGFVEFESVENAKIAAETMNDYLLDGHILKCALVSKKKLPENAFSKRRINFTSKSFDINYQRSFNKNAMAPTTGEKLTKLIERRNEKKKLLHKLNIKYKLPEISEVAK